MDDRERPLSMRGQEGMVPHAPACGSSLEARSPAEAKEGGRRTGLKGGKKRGDGCLGQRDNEQRSRQEEVARQPWSSHVDCSWS